MRVRQQLIKAASFSGFIRVPPGEERVRNAPSSQIDTLGNNTGNSFSVFVFTMKNQKSLRIFILEDDLWYSSMLEYYLSLNPDYVIQTRCSG